MTEIHFTPTQNVADALNDSLNQACELGEHAGKAKAYVATIGKIKHLPIADVLSWLEEQLNAETTAIQRVQDESRPHE